MLIGIAVCSELSKLFVAAEVHLVVLVVAAMLVLLNSGELASTRFTWFVLVECRRWPLVLTANLGRLWFPRLWDSSRGELAAKLRPPNARVTNMELHRLPAALLR